MTRENAISTRNPATPRSSQYPMISLSAAGSPWLPHLVLLRRLFHGRPGVPEVERWLLREEVLHIPARRRPGEATKAPPGRIPSRCSGDRNVVLRRTEPRVVDRCVPCDQIEQYPHSARAGLPDHGHHVLVGTVAGCNGEVIRHVIAGVPERRCEARVEPDHVHAQPLQVVQATQNSGKVPDPVAVRIREGLRIIPRRSRCSPAIGEVTSSRCPGAARSRASRLPQRMWLWSSAVPEGERRLRRGSPPSKATSMDQVRPSAADWLLAWNM